MHSIQILSVSVVNKIILKNVVVSGDVLQLTYNPGDFFATVSAVLEIDGKACKVSKLLWECIDYLSVKEIKQLLGQHAVSIKAEYDKNQLFLRLCFTSPAVQLPFFVQENASAYKWIPGFQNMITYLTKTLEPNNTRFKTTTFAEAKTLTPLTSLIHQAFKHKTTTVAALLSDVHTEKSYFLQKFALNMLKHFHLGSPLVIYCPLTQLKDPSRNLIRETLALYGLSAHEAFLKSYPTLWVIDGLEQVFQQRGTRFNLLGTNDAFKRWNSHYLIGFIDSPDYPRDYPYFDPIERVRVMHPKPCRFFDYTMTCMPKSEQHQDEIDKILTMKVSQTFFEVPKHSVLSSTLDQKQDSSQPLPCLMFE